MDACDALRERRSIRAYKPDPVPRETLLTILDCARLAPNGSNRQSWKFVCVTDAAMRAKVAKEARYGGFIAQAPVLVAVFAGPEALTPVEDASCATLSMMIAAKAHGLGSCWVWGNKQPHSLPVARLLGAPENWELITLLALGWPDEQPKPRKKTIDEVVCWEAFS